MDQPEHFSVGENDRKCLAHLTINVPEYAWAELGKKNYSEVA